MEWLNYHHLYYFWTVAKEQSFTKAATKLRIAQSAVSYQVAQLEDFLGKKLILRSTSKKLSLTEDGQLVFRQAEEIFRQGKELVDGLKEGGVQSTLKVGAIGSLSKNLQIQLLKPVLERPEFQVSIQIADADTLLQSLKSYALDIILCDVPFLHSEDEPLIQREIAREPICLVHRTGKSKLDLEAYISKHGIYLPARNNPLTNEIEQYLAGLKIKYHVRGYIDDIALLRVLALQTESVVAIPRVGVINELKNQSLKLRHQFKSKHQKFFLVLRQNSGRAKKILSALNQTF